MTALDRGFVALAGIAGLAGVGLAAMAAHVTGGGSLQTASSFLLFHAPALMAAAMLAASGLVHPRLVRAAASALVLGLALFCGDLTMRALLTTPLFPMAAPIGGTILMAGWLLIAVSALAGRR